MYKIIIALLLIFTGATLPSSAAEPMGFAILDLTQVNVNTSTFGNTKFVHRADPDRITFICTECKDFHAVDVLLNKSKDGTEARYRSGKTTIADLEKLCRQREQSCTLQRVDLNGAVGWISCTKFASTAISTTVLSKNGDMLIIRSIANTAQVAFENGTSVRVRLAPQIIGR